MPELLTISDCSCIGYNTTFRCITIGNGTTKWQGTAFHCPYSGNEISLLHEKFSDPDGTEKQCNGGGIVGQSVEVQGNRYTSHLFVDVTLELNGTTVECEYVNLSSSQEESRIIIGQTQLILTAGMHN